MYDLSASNINIIFKRMKSYHDYLGGKQLKKEDANNNAPPFS